MLEFDVVDVFTREPFSGNQLAVVHGAQRLSTAQCLAIACEFGFSETTFPGPVDPAAGEYGVRIFTPSAEIPFAGHPTLGTAAVLRSRGELPADRAVQVCGAGRVDVGFDGDDVELSAAPRDLAGPLDETLAGALLADLGLAAADLAGPVHLAGCGLTFVHVPVGREAVARAVPSSRPLAAYADRLARYGETADPVEGVNLVAVAGRAPSLTVHARVFVPGLSVAEDPATGSAAVGLGMALVASGALPEGGRYQITQGVEMGRPSSLSGRVETASPGSGGVAVPGRSAEVSRCHVGGGVRAVAHGHIAVPPA